MSDRGLGFISDMCHAIDRMNREMEDRIREENSEPETEPEETVTLSKEELRQLRWMSSEQLRAIFGGGKKRKVRLDKTSADIYSMLKWFSAEQLDAIFGGGI